MQAKLGAELCSALCSAASEDLTAVCGGHSLAEAVLFFALTLFGLIGTEHRVFLLSSNTQQQDKSRRSEQIQSTPRNRRRLNIIY